MVNVGSTVLLSCDIGNAKDPNAIAVYTENGFDQVGWVGNSPAMVTDGTKSATDVWEDLERQDGSMVKGKIVANTTVTYNSGRFSDAYVVEFKTKGEFDMSTIQNFTVKIIGSKSQYPVRFEQVIPDYKNGNVPYLKLVVKGEEIEAEYNGLPCGHVSKEKENGVSDYDLVLASIGESITAKVSKVAGTKVVAEFSVDEKEVANNVARQTLPSVLKNILDQGISTQEEIDMKAEYLRKVGATEKQILHLFMSYKLYDVEVAKLIPQKPKTLYQDETGIVKRSVAYINMKRNLMLEGDRGVGKNVMIETLAWLYNRPLFEFSLNSQHDNSSLLGGKTIEVDENGNNVMGFDPEVVVQAGEEGGFLVLDEFNTSIGHVMSLLNSYLDDRRRLSVPGYKVIQADENFIAFGTMNKDYQSTFELNEATSDRFVPIIFPKAKSIKETLMAKCPEVDLRIITTCDKLYQGILKCVIDGEISDKAVTIRGFIDACLGTEMDLPLKETLIDNVANRCSDLDDRKAVANMVEDILG